MIPAASLALTHLDKGLTIKDVRSQGKFFRCGRLYGERGRRVEPVRTREGGEGVNFSRPLKTQVKKFYIDSLPRFKDHSAQ